MTGESGDKIPRVRVVPETEDTRTPDELFRDAAKLLFELKFKEGGLQKEDGEIITLAEGLLGKIREGEVDEYLRGQIERERQECRRLRDELYRLGLGPF